MRHASLDTTSVGLLLSKSIERFKQKARIQQTTDRGDDKETTLYGEVCVGIA